MVIISFLLLSSFIASSGAIYQSPKKQIEQGMSITNVKCNDDLILIKKIDDNSPACVRTQTAVNLVKRGWGEMTNVIHSESNVSQKLLMENIAIENTSYSMNYSMTGGKIMKASGNLNNDYAILLSMSVIHNGTVTLELPIAGSLGKSNCDNDISIHEDGIEVFPTHGEFSLKVAKITFDLINGTREVLLQGECTLG